MGGKQEKKLVWTFVQMNFVHRLFMWETEVEIWNQISCKYDGLEEPVGFLGMEPGFLVLV